MGIEDGQVAARLCAVNLVSQISAACEGDLDRVSQLLKVEGFVNSTPDFEGHPQVINGCSDLLGQIFGEKVGQHSRFAVGCASLPLGVSVEVGAVVEIDGPGAPKNEAA